MNSGGSAYNQRFGNKGEKTAVNMFKDSGFSIIKRNFRFGKAGEIDIIARKGDLIVFAEVKARSSTVFGGALYSITEKKKQTLRIVARHFLRSHPQFFSKEITYRFDLIAIQDGDVNWVEDIIRN